MMVCNDDLNKNIKMVLGNVWSANKYEARKVLRNSQEKAERSWLLGDQLARKYEALGVAIGLVADRGDYPLPIQKKEGRIFRRQLVWYCPICGIVLCEKDRAGNMGGEWAYYLCDCGYEYVKYLGGSCYGGGD